jgi:hypothetical protein
VDPRQVNFRRAVMLLDASDHRYGASGEITRVRMNRAGTSVVSEEMDVPIGGHSSGEMKITVDNGDNPPLAISGVQLLSVERRLYFDPLGKSLLRLYYGDNKLDSPVYDYARFFKTDPAAAPLRMTRSFRLDDKNFSASTLRLQRSSRDASGLRVVWGRPPHPRCRRVPSDQSGERRAHSQSAGGAVAGK